MMNDFIHVHKAVPPESLVANKAEVFHVDAGFYSNRAEATA